MLTLAVLQPVIVLYIVYWRKHRKEASLDVIIKLFAVGKSPTQYRLLLLPTHPPLHPPPGFFLTAQFAGMTEPIVELLLMSIAAAAGVLPRFDPEKTTEADVQQWVQGHLGLVILMTFCMAFFVAALVEELYK